MHQFRVESVDEHLLTLSQDGKTYHIPRSLLDAKPEVGQTVVLAAAIRAPDAPVSNPLARDLLNTLLSSS